MEGDFGLECLEIYVSTFEGDFSEIILDYFFHIVLINKSFFINIDDLDVEVPMEVGCTICRLKVVQAGASLKR